MSIRPPFQWLPTSVQPRAFWAALTLMLLVFAGLFIFHRPLMTDDAPWGIISFQTAGELGRSRTIVESWGPAGRINAGLNLGLDYLLLVLYAIVISLGCMMSARLFSQRVAVLYMLGIILSWAAIGAALLDALENYALIRILLGTRLELWPSVALWSSILKFSILGISLGYLVIAYPLRRIMTFRER